MVDLRWAKVDEVASRVRDELSEAERRQLAAMHPLDLDMVVTLVKRAYRARKLDARECRSADVVYVTGDTYGNPNGRVPVRK